MKDATELINTNQYDSNGLVIWITGLSGAGKTTLAKAIKEKFTELHQGLILLDGDEMRQVFQNENEIVLNYSKEERKNLALKYSKICQILSRQNFNVVIATISMLSEVYEWNRNNIENYFEIYLDVPMSELRTRDQKSMYSSFEKGEINNVMGLDLEVVIPIEPDIHICWNKNVSTESLVQEIYETLIRQKRI